jgi:hypothetical protein
MEKSEIRCVEPECVSAIEKYGEIYHSVHDGPKGALCERCGSIYKDGVWSKTCKTCGCHPTSLHGLFVPHLCPDCYAKRQKNDRKCGMCRQPIIDCCC